MQMNFSTWSSIVTASDDCAHDIFNLGHRNILVAWECWKLANDASWPHVLGDDCVMQDIPPAYLTRWNPSLPFRPRSTEEFIYRSLDPTNINWLEIRNGATTDMHFDSRATMAQNLSIKGP